jgi:hypothetical protein
MRALFDNRPSSRLAARARQLRSIIQPRYGQPNLGKQASSQSTTPAPSPSQTLPSPFPRCRPHLKLTQCTINEPIAMTPSMTQQLPSTTCSRPHSGAATVQQCDCPLGVHSHLTGPFCIKKPPLEPTELGRAASTFPTPSIRANVPPQNTAIGPSSRVPWQQQHVFGKSPRCDIYDPFDLQQFGCFCGEPRRQRGPCGLARALLAARRPVAVRTCPYRLVSAAEAVVRKGKRAGCETARAAL